MTINVESEIKNLSEEQCQILSKYGSRQQHASKKLFNFLTHNEVNKDTFKILQQQYIKEFNIHARVFKSIWISVNAEIKSQTTRNKNKPKLYKTKINDLEHQISKIKKLIEQAELAKQPNQKKIDKLYTKLYYTYNKLNQTQQKLNSFKLTYNCLWGGKKLYKEQWKQFKEDKSNPHAPKNKEDQKELWLKDWRRQRNNKLYLVGSKDETFGNSLCQLVNLKTLQLRLPKDFPQRHLNLEVNFDYKNKRNYQLLLKAINNNQSLTYNLLQRKNGKWYAQISFSISNDCPNYNNGAYGIDINYDLITGCSTKKDGNPELFENFKFLTEDKISNQNTQALIDIVIKIVSFAKQNKKMLVVEDIDLDKCKAKDIGKVGNKKISMVLYHKLIQLLKSRAIKEGVLVKTTNPAFSSVIAKLKYSKQLGRTTHATAALVLARRGQQFNELIPTKLASLLQGEEKKKWNWKDWSLVHKKFNQVSQLEKSKLMLSHQLGHT